MNAPETAPPADAAPAPRRSRRKEARPGELLAAALENFLERGYAATRLEDVAARAGVSKGTIYLYFPSKEELFKAVVRETILPNIVRAEGVVHDFPGSSRALLENILRGWWTTIGQSNLSRIPKLIIGEAGNFPELARFYADEVIARGRHLLGEVLSRGVARGEFRPLDVEHTVRVLMAPLVFAALWRHSIHAHDSEPMDFDRYLEAMLELVFDGLLHKDPP